MERQSRARFTTRFIISTASRPTKSAMNHVLRSINPATTEVLRTFETHSDAEIESKLQRASDAFREHRRLSFADRAALMQRVADVLESERAEHARTITLEMGKPIRAAVQEIEKCATCCRFYAE